MKIAFKSIAGHVDKEGNSNPGEGNTKLVLARFLKSFITRLSWNHTFFSDRVIMP